MDERKPVITFDTSCIYPEGHTPPEITELENLHRQGVIQIVKTDVVDTELLETAKEGLKRKSAMYDEDMGTTVYGHSRYDHSLYADDESERNLQAILNMVFPDHENFGEEAKKSAIRDAMHLATHQKHKRDMFVTRDDHHIMRKAIELERELGIIVLTPEKCLERLRVMLT